MTTSLSNIRVLAQITTVQSKTVDVGTSKHSIAPMFSLQLTDGNGNAQANEVYQDTNTLNASTDIDYDLAGGITDAFGNTLTLTKVKAILLENTSDQLSTPTTATISIGGGDGANGTNAFDTWITSTANDGSERVYVPVGGAILLAAPTGYTVTAGTADILTIKNESGSVQASYRLTLLGVA